MTNLTAKVFVGLGCLICLLVLAYLMPLVFTGQKSNAQLVAVRDGIVTATGNVVAEGPAQPSATTAAGHDDGLVYQLPVVNAADKARAVLEAQAYLAFRKNLEATLSQDPSKISYAERSIIADQLRTKVTAFRDIGLIPDATHQIIERMLQQWLAGEHLLKRYNLEVAAEGAGSLQPQTSSGN